MIEYTNGDILKADVEALVNPVNCVGVMGRGLALLFRNAYPANFKAYKAVCDRGELEPGKMFLYPLNTVANPRYIINFPTKKHWKSQSQIDYIDTGLVALIAEVHRLGIRSIAFPPLGCGLGGLDWEEVRPRIEQAFTELPDVRVLLYAPAESPRDIATEELFAKWAEEDAQLTEEQRTENERIYAEIEKSGIPRVQI